jgi:hypothetical protein
MSQRESGYQRKLLDQYETPAWVTLALIPHLPEFTGKVWEPACGSGKMVAVLQQAFSMRPGATITQGVDFLGQAPETGVRAIITNPPYALAQKFIERRCSRGRNALAHGLRPRGWPSAPVRRLRDVCQKSRADQAHPMV